MGKTKKMDERLDSEKNSYSHILKYTGLFGGVQGLNMLVGVVRNKFTAMFLGPSGMGLLSLFILLPIFFLLLPISVFLPVALEWFLRQIPEAG